MAAAANLTQSIPTKVLDNLYVDAFYALHDSYKLQKIYNSELKSHSVIPSSLPLNLGESNHFKQLKKPRGSSKDVQDFLTVSYKGAYALFLGTTIMLENPKPGTSAEKTRLTYVNLHLANMIFRLYWQLRGRGFPVPKTNERVDKEKLKKRLENLVKIFIKDKHIRPLIPPFLGEEVLLLKWGLNNDYSICFNQFMSKLKGTNRRRSTI